MKSFLSFQLHASHFCSWLLIPALAVSPLVAQSPSAASALDNTDLQLHITEGAAPEAQVNSSPAKGLVVEVTNAAGTPVADAAVALRLPDSGATGTFTDGSHAAVAYTDASGKAQFNGLHWGQTPGPVTLRVTATKGTSHAALLFNEALSATAATASAAAPAVAPEAPQVRVAPQVAVTKPQVTSSQIASQQVAAVQPQPAVVAQPATAPISKMAQPLAQSGASPAPLQPAKPEPTVTVSGASPDAVHHSGKTKWIILAAVIAAGAGAGVAMASKGKSSTSTASAITIGTPGVSVGAPH